MTQVKQEMTHRVSCVLEDESLLDAYHAMTTIRVRHVPVIRGNKLVGVLSDRDILLHAKKEDGLLVVPDIPVKHVMSIDLVVCRQNNKIGTVADLMLENRIDCLPVVGPESALIGIITSTDLIRLLRNENWSLETDLVPLKFERFALLGDDVLED